MHPATEALLQAQKLLAEHVRRHPTDVEAIRDFRIDFNRAASDWAKAGYPDCPPVSSAEPDSA